MEWIDVNQAAAVLGVDPRQVRKLAADGTLAGRKLGRTWLLVETSVRDRARLRSRAGRPLSADMAWHLLVACARAGSGGDPFAELSDRQLRWRIRTLLDRAPEPMNWPVWLRRRAVEHRLWLHPGTRDRFARDPRVLHPDLSDRLGVRVADLIPYYVASEDLDDLVADYRGRLGGEGTKLMAVGPVSDDLDWRGAVQVAALVDLVTARDARVTSAAQEALAAAAAKLTDRMRT